MPPRHAAFPTRCTRLSTQAPAQTRPAGSDMRPPSLLERRSLRKPRYRLLRHIITSRSTVSLFIFNPPSLFTFHRLFYCILVFLSFAMFNHFTSYINLSITFYFLIYIKISRSFFTIIFNQSQYNPKT